MMKTIIQCSSECTDPRMEEIPIPIDEQREYLKDINEELEDKIKTMEVLIKKAPYEVMKQAELRKYLKDNDMDHFVDPHFPP